MPVKGYDLILHIGLPKTGSSAIQKLFSENVNELLEQGYFYPPHETDANGISGGHAVLSDALREGALDDAKRYLAEQYRDAQSQNLILLLSSEGFFNRPEQAIELFKGYRVLIIAFFRHPVDALLSEYNQLVKRHQKSFSMIEFLTRALNNPQPRITHTLLLNWAECFGSGQMRVFPYSKGGENGDSPVNRILKFLNISLPSQAAKEERVNGSYCASALELKRLVNHLLNDSDSDLDQNLDNYLQAYSDQRREEIEGPVADFALELHTALANKFDSELEHMKEKLGFILPTYVPPSHNAFSFRRLNKQLIDLVEQLEADNPELYRKLEEKLDNNSVQLTANDGNCLYQLFERSSPNTFSVEQEHWFGDQVLKAMPDYTEVDFLRETARLAFKRGQLEVAEKLIDRARALRNKGPEIIRLQSTIKEKLKA